MLVLKKYFKSSENGFLFIILFLVSIITAVHYNSPWTPASFLLIVLIIIRIIFINIKINRNEVNTQTLKAKDNFIVAAVHRLRTPLAAINWTFQSLDKEKLSIDSKGLVVTGLAASAQLVKIVDDLLDIIKIEEEKFDYKFKKIDLIKFIQDTLKQIELISKKYDVDISLELPKEKTIDAIADSEKLSLVMINLLENAIKYNNRKGKVVISIERLIGKAFVQVNIADTGVGIPEEKMNNLFAKFIRGENVIEKETEGSGLGLYIAKEIISRHGGQIWAESALNKGTTFHFTLPTNKRLVLSD